MIKSYCFILKLKKHIEAKLCLVRLQVQLTADLLLQICLSVLCRRVPLCKCNIARVDISTLYSVRSWYINQEKQFVYELVTIATDPSRDLSQARQ